MNSLKSELQDVYGLEYEAMQHRILANCTVDEETLDAVETELDGGYLPVAYEKRKNDSRMHADDFEALMYLDEAGELKEDVEGGILPTVALFVVYYALAYMMSRLAANLFKGPLPPGWTLEDVVREGMRAAKAADKAFLYAELLRIHGVSTFAKQHPLAVQSPYVLC